MKPVRQFVIAMAIAGTLGLGLLVVVGVIAYRMIASTDTSDFVPVDVKVAVVSDPEGTRVKATVVATKGQLLGDLEVAADERDPIYELDRSQFPETSDLDHREYNTRALRTEITVERIDERTARVSYLVSPRKAFSDNVGESRRIVVVNSPIEKTLTKSVEVSFGSAPASCVQPDTWSPVSGVLVRPCASGSELRVVEDRWTDGHPDLAVWLRVVMS